MCARIIVCCFQKDCATMYVCPKYSESRCKDVGGHKQVPKKVIIAIRILGGGQKLFGEVGRLYIYL